jgi:hypothetical protein
MAGLPHTWLALDRSLQAFKSSNTLLLATSECWRTYFTIKMKQADELLKLSWFHDDIKHAYKLYSRDVKSIIKEA